MLVLSRELFNRRSETAIMMAVTSQPQKAGFPLTLALPEGLLPRPSWEKVSQVRTISTNRLGKRLGVLDAGALTSLVEGLIELIASIVTEPVVAVALRNTLPEFLATAAKTSILVKFIRDRLDLSGTAGTSLAA